jgi:hypothetical protein
MDLSKSALICLVSRQAMANVIPALMHKPAKVVLLKTKEEEATAENIKGVMNLQGIDCEIYPELIDPYDVVNTEQIVNNVVVRNCKNLIPVFNSTGGTKLMAFAAYNVFRQNKLKIIYCDTDGNRIIELYPQTLFEEISVNISVKEYLRAYGYYIIPSEKIRNDHSAFIQYIDKNNLLKHFISQIIEKRKNDIFRLSNHSTPMHLGNFRIILEDTSFISISHDKNTFGHIDKNFLNGFWLEDYLFYKLKELQPDDIILGAHISSGSKNTLAELQALNLPYNEIDVIAVKNTRLYLFSCKSGVKSKEDLFELDGLRSIAGGTFGKAYAVVTKSTPTYSNRAKSMRINMFDIRDINSFKF